MMILTCHGSKAAHLPEHPLQGVDSAPQVLGNESLGLVRQIQQYGPGFENGYRRAALHRRLIDDGRHPGFRRDGKEFGAELFARADVHRDDGVWHAGLFEKKSDLVAVGGRPIIQVDHGCTSGGSSAILCCRSIAMQTSSWRGKARICTSRARARAFFVHGNSGLSSFAAAATRHSKTCLRSAIARASLLSAANRCLSMLKPTNCATIVSPRCMIFDSLKQSSRRSAGAPGSRQASTSAVKGGMTSPLAIPLTVLSRAASDAAKPPGNWSRAASRASTISTTMRFQ